MGIIAVLMYGIMVTLSVLYPTLSSMWVGAVLLVALGMFVAAVVGIVVGWLVLPSLASDEVSQDCRNTRLVLYPVLLCPAA